MTWSVDEVEDVALVLHLDGVALDGDAFFTLQVHIIEHLSFHIALAQRLREFQQAIGQSAFTVVYMSDYAEVSYAVHCHRLQI